MQFKSIIIITIIWLAVLLSGCLGEKTAAPVPTNAIPAIIATTIPSTTGIIPQVTQTGNETTINSQGIPTVASSVTIPGELPRNTLFVTARLKKPANWSSANEIKYELNTLKVSILNQQNIPLLIKAQIMSGDQILEEKSFNLKDQGSSVEFTNEKNHFINSTNVTLRLLVQGYPPIDYEFITVDQLN